MHQIEKINQENRKNAEVGLGLGTGATQQLLGEAFVTALLNFVHTKLCVFHISFMYPYQNIDD